VRKIQTEGLYNIDYIFYLKFRDINYEKKTNLLEFLVNDSAILNTFKPNELDILLHELVKSEKVGIVMDGFDEAAVTESSKLFRKKCSVFDKELPETFISNLLTGNILPKAKLLVTSRPRQLLQLPKEYKPKFIVKILGLGSDGQKQICDEICREEEVKIDKVKQYIENRPDLKGYCYVPINCILVMLCIFSSLQLSDMIDMDSITTILVAALGLFIENGHLRGDEFQIKNLCELAFSGFIANKVYFDEQDLKRAKINKENASAFLTTSITKKIHLKLWGGKETTKTYFSHLMLHEFFVALYLLLYADEKQLKSSLKVFATNKYEIVTKFLFGLCNSNTLAYLEELIPFEMINHSSIESTKDQLKTLVFKELDEINNWYLKQERFVHFLQVSTWVYELRDDQFTASVANKIDEIISIEGNILPIDIPAMNYLLRARSNKLSIASLTPIIPKDESKLFYNELHKTLQNQNISVSNPI